MNPLERYEPLVDDAAGFRAACERPLPSVVRVNTIKSTVERARRGLDSEGVEYAVADWHDGLLRLQNRSPGKNWAYVHGWLHGQEEVSVLPGLVLDPQSDDRVLDLCAAPGSKTSHIAARMQDRGTLVANDNNLGRLSALRHNCERLGVSNVAVTNQDGRNYSMQPFDFDVFDRVLVDAPCSCEGTCRKNPDVLDEWTLDHVRSVVGIQKGLLRRAIQLTKPGGRVVYSTCTFAPEENEAVIDHVLTREPCQVEPVDVPLETADGITEWQGETFDESVSETHRVYPHHNDTGGFYCAALEVTG